MNAEGNFTEAEVELLYAKQKGLCIYCSAPLGASFHRDHKTPLTRGGSNFIANIQLLCAPCNTRKNDKLHDEYAEKIGFITDLM